MSKTSVQLPTPRKARPVCEHFALSPRAEPLLDDEVMMRQFLARLLRQELYGDALKTVAHYLEKRYAVWWGCLCARHVAGKPLPPLEEAALQSAVRWVLEPTEEHRRAAQAPAEAATLMKPAGCLAHAVLWSGGSMAAPEFPIVPPKPYMTAQTVSGAILLAAAQAPPAQFVATQARFLAMGMGVALRHGLWEW